MVLNPVDDQFQVNTAIANDFLSSVASDRNGNFVVTWTREVQPGDRDIFARRFRADGTPDSGEFRVNQFRNDNQTAPVVGMDANGNFVIAWASDGQDGDGTGIYAQRYEANGNRIGTEFRVNTSTDFDQRDPAIAMDQNGRFVITWASQASTNLSDIDIFARTFNASGAPIGSNFQVNTSTDDRHDFPAASIASDGTIAITWESEDLDIFSSGDRDVLARLFNSSGTPLSNEFQVNVATEGEQFNPAIGMAPNGNYVVTWTDQNSDSSVFRLVGRRFSGDLPASGEFTIESSTDGTQGDSVIGIDDSGNFVVAWTDVQVNLVDLNISARRYNADGTSDGGVIRVNSLGFNTSPAISSDADGDIVMTWTGSGSIQARQFSPQQGNPGDNPNRQIGTPRDDRLRGTQERDILRGLGGNDRLIGRGGDDTLVGGVGNDVMNGGGGNDNIKGSGGRDRLLGKAGDDRLNGGGGNDILDGGSGVDRVRGGGGRDVFRLRRGQGLSRISDFSRRDRLDLVGAFTRQALSFTRQDNGTLISLGRNDELAFLEGIRPEQLNARSFV